MPLMVAHVVSVNPHPHISTGLSTIRVCKLQSYPTVAVYRTSAAKDNTLTVSFNMFDVVSGVARNFPLRGQEGFRTFSGGATD